MLSNLIWNDFFLTQGTRDKIINSYTIPQNVLGNSFSQLLYRFIHPYIENTSSEPVIFKALECDSNIILKLHKMLSWGKKVKSSSLLSIVLLDKAISLYEEKKLALSRLYKIFDILIDNTAFLISSTCLYQRRKEKLVDNDTLKIINKIVKDKNLITYLLEHRSLCVKQKALISYIAIDSAMTAHYEAKYSCAKNQLKEDIISWIESLVEYGYMFKTENTSYHTLHTLFSLEVDEHINNRTLMTCYEQFSYLKTRTKKMIAASLIKKNKETPLFNLLSYGLNLNWVIKKENGEENILALEMLSSIPMIKMILSSKSFNVCTANKEGNNILHLLGSLPLLNQDVRQILTKRIMSLSSFEQSLLFYQYNKNNLTPVLKALNIEDKELVEYFLELGVNPEVIVEGIEAPYHNPIEYVNQACVSSQSIMNFYKHEWNAKKLQNQLLSNLKLKSKINKKHKI